MVTYGNMSNESGTLPQSVPMMEIELAPPISYPNPALQSSAGFTQQNVIPSHQTARNNLFSDQHAPASVSLDATQRRGDFRGGEYNSISGLASGYSLKDPQEGIRDGGFGEFNTGRTTQSTSGVSAPNNYGRPPESSTHANQVSRNTPIMPSARRLSSSDVAPHFDAAHDRRPPVARSNSTHAYGALNATGKYQLTESSTPIHDVYATRPTVPGFNQDGPLISTAPIPTPIAPTIAPKEPEIIYFYDMHARYYEFTNFSPDPVTYKGKVYPTSEHLFQAMKFINTRPLLAEHIRTYSNRPRDAFTEARRFQPEWDPAWHSIKIKRMDEVLELKFNSTNKLRNLLINTGDAVLVEDSPVDDFWGVGADRKGKNELGLALMRLRNKLKPQRNWLY